MFHLISINVSTNVVNMDARTSIHDSSGYKEVYPCMRSQGATTNIAQVSTYTSIPTYIHTSYIHPQYLHACKYRHLIYADTYTHNTYIQTDMYIPTYMHIVYDACNANFVEIVWSP